MRCRVCIPILLCALLFDGVALAASPWNETFFAGAARDVLAAANQVDLPVDGEVVVLFDERRQVYRSDGAAESRYRQVYQVRTESAAQGWNSLDAYWEPWHEERPEVRARVVAPDGRVFVLDPKTIEVSTVRSSDRDVYTDRHALRAPLPGITRGAVVETEVVTRDTKPLFEDGEVASWIFVSGVQVEESRLVVDAPDSLPVSFKLTNAEGVKRSEARTDGRVVTTFSGGPWKAREPLFPHSPPELHRSSYVRYTTGRSWRQVAGRYAAVVETQLKGADLRSFARETTQRAKSRDARIAALVERLNRETRYTGVEFGAAAIIPRPPAEVLARRFGDCKDKSTLLVGLLRALGIEAYVALLYADVGGDIDETLPGMGGFNHAIVYLPGSPTLWIDPSDAYLPPGELPLTAQGRLALIASPRTTELVKTPVAPSKKNLTQEVRELMLAEDGSIRLTERTRYQGVMAGTARRSHATGVREEVEASLHKYASEEYKVKGIAGWSRSAPEDVSQDFTLELTAEGVRMGEVSGETLALPLPVLPLFRDLPLWIRAPEEAATTLPPALKGVKRTVDFVYPLAYSYELVIRIQPAHGFVVQELPPDESIHLGPARLTFTCRSQADHTVEARYLFDSGPNRLTAEALGKFQVDYAAYMKSPVQVVKLVLGAEALKQAGKIQQALAAFRQLDKEHPGSAHHAAQLAHALLAAGLGEAARQQARRATVLDPKSSSAFTTLGTVLQHDLLGRAMQPGFDGPGAERAFQRAIELDAENVHACSQLALMAEYDEEGKHNWPAARLGTALERHERHQKMKNRDQSSDLNYLLTLFRLKRYSEVIAKAKSLPATIHTHGLVLASVVLTKGAAEAVRQSTGLVQNAEERPEALRMAGAEILALRHYPESTLLFSEAARGHKSAADLRLFAETLRRTKRAEKRAINRHDPKDVLRGLMRLMFSEGALTKRELYPFWLQDQVDKVDDVKAAKKAFQLAALRQMRNPDFPIGALADIVWWREWTQVGDPRWGVWVYPTESSPTQGLFFVPRSDGFRLLAVGHGVPSPEFGQEALRLLDKGDVGGAGYLLDQYEDLFRDRRQADPLDVIPFLSAWRQGAKGDPGFIRLAIALVDQEGPLAKPEEERLQTCRRSAAEPARTSCDLALLFRLDRTNRRVESQAIAEGLLARYPNSERAIQLATGLAIRNRDFNTATRLMRAALAQKPGDASVMLLMSDLLISQGRGTEAEATLRKVIESGKSQAVAYNNLAWNAMAMGKTDAAVVDNARQSVRLSQRKYAGHLHTLAAVLADAGQVEEARDTLLELLALREDQQPDNVDWFVIGRIAEQYGDRDAARSAYLKVAATDSPGPHNPYSTQILAQQRLRALEGK